MLLYFIHSGAHAREIERNGFQVSPSESYAFGIEHIHSDSRHPNNKPREEEGGETKGATGGINSGTMTERMPSGRKEVHARKPSLPPLFLAILMRP